MFRLEEVESGQFSCQVEEGSSMEEQDVIQSLKRLSPNAHLDMRLFSKTRLITIHSKRSNPCSLVELALWAVGCLLVIAGLTN
jgi:hypothetical protein